MGGTKRSETVAAAFACGCLLAASLLMQYPARLWPQLRAQQAAVSAPPNVYQYKVGDHYILRPSKDEPRIPFSPRLAVDYMEQGTAGWTEQWKCVSCHTNGSYMVVRPLLTAELGVPQAKMREFFVSELDRLRSEPQDKQVTAGTQIVYIAAGLAIWDAQVTHRLSPETSEAMELLFSLQRPGGDWFVDDDNNPPLESSSFQVATVAARAVGNAPGWLEQQRGTAVAGKVRLLQQFLRAEAKTQGDYDKVDLLWAAAEWPGLLDAQQEHELVNMIFAHQKLDGGWSIRTFATPEQWGKGNRAAKLRAEEELLDPPSDGHMTGLALIALRKAGVPASDPHVRAGVKWLLENQRSSGRWWTRSLNRDGWQFISYSSTVYPLLALALCNALPNSAG